MPRAVLPTGRMLDLFHAFAPTSLPCVLGFQLFRVSNFVTSSTLHLGDMLPNHFSAALVLAKTNTPSILLRQGQDQNLMSLTMVRPQIQVLSGYPALGARYPADLVLLLDKSAFACSRFSHPCWDFHFLAAGRPPRSQLGHLPFHIPCSPSPAT